MAAFMPDDLWRCLITFFPHSAGFTCGYSNSSPLGLTKQLRPSKPFEKPVFTLFTWKNFNFLTSFYSSLLLPAAAAQPILPLHPLHQSLPAI